MGVSDGLPTAVEPYLAAPKKTLPQPAPYIGSPRYPAEQPKPQRGQRPGAHAGVASEQRQRDGQPAPASPHR